MIRYPGLGDREPLDRVFDFEKFPNIEEVTFIIHWVAPGPLWIPRSLSTFKPTTSPRLFFIRINIGHRCKEKPEEEFDDDIQSVRDQVSRIKREFTGAVDSTVWVWPKLDVSDTLISLTICSSQTSQD